MNPNNIDFTDIENWEPEILWNYINFCNGLLDPKTGKLTTNKKLVSHAREILMQEQHPFHPFIKHLENESMEPGRFYTKIKQILIEVLNNYRENPFLITEQIRTCLEGHEEYSWIFLNTVPMIKDSPDVIMANSLVSSINLMADISQSITKKDIKAMQTRDKINALKTLSFVWKVLKDFRPNPKAFSGIEGQIAKREDLERKMLEHAEG